MVEPLDEEASPNGGNTSLGMDGIEVQLEDYSEATHPKAMGSEEEQGKHESKLNKPKDTGKVKDDEEETKVRLAPKEPMPNQLLDREPTKFEKACPFLSLRPLAPYFNVTTPIIRKRMIGSLMPFRYNNFYETYSEQPDLYGPFWILTTIICTIFIAGNFERYSRTEEEEDFEYNFRLVPIAAMILYGVGLGLPLLLKSVLKLYGIQDNTKPLAVTAGIYGYSFSSFIITTLICAIPIDWLQWLAIGYSAVCSLVFLFRMYWQDFKENLDGKIRWVAILFLCVVQLALLLIFKLYFFKHV